MTEVQKAIEELTYYTPKFPKQALKVITENKEEALPYLHSAIEKVIEEKDEIDEDYNLHFYAFYLLAELKDTAFFEKIIEFLSLPSEVIEDLLGDALTDGMCDVVYNLYNGNLPLLEDTIRNASVNEYIRAELLIVLTQLYRDGVVEKQAFKDFLKQMVYHEEEYSFFCNELAMKICKCHFVDMLPDIRYLLAGDMIDENFMGEYVEFVDAMFDYSKEEEVLCISPFHVAEHLQNWAMFTENDKEDSKREQQADAMQMIRALEKEMHRDVTKIGRNDPCYCGSGKKYKFCCLNKQKSELDRIEESKERQKCLKKYPPIGVKRQQGRIYLEDFYDAESIELDQLVYLALKNRPQFFWERKKTYEELRSLAYLKLAFEKFKAKVEKEQIHSFAEYDKVYSIHYESWRWIEDLLDLLEEYEGTQDFYQEVVLLCKKLQ